MRNRLYDMCIIFLNNVYVNNKTVYDKKSTRMYVEIQKAKTVCAGLQHVRCAGIVSSVGRHRCHHCISQGIFCEDWRCPFEASSSGGGLQGLRRCLSPH